MVSEICLKGGVQKIRFLCEGFVCNVDQLGVVLFVFSKEALASIDNF